MNMTEYIIEFLLQNNTVTIKSVGTLRLEYVPAHFDSITNRFLPSSKNVILTPEQAENEDFIHFLMGKENISETLALQFWNNYTDVLVEKLKTENLCRFSHIGYFKKNTDGSISFAQNEGVNLIEDSFGLEVVNDLQTYHPDTYKIPEETTIEESVVEEAPEQIEEEVVIETTVKEPIGEEKIPEQEVAEEEEVVEEEIIEIATNEPVVEENEPEQEQEIVEEEATTETPQPEVAESESESESESADTEVHICKPSENKQEEIKKEEPIEIKESICPPIPPKLAKKKNKTRTILLFLIIILLLIGVFACYWFFCKGAHSFCHSGEKNDTTQTEMETSQQEDAIPLDTVSFQEEFPTATDVNIQDNSVGNRTVDGILFRQKSKDGTDIITGFFKIEANALKQARQMQEIGYTPYIIERMPNGEKQFYVSIGSFGKKEEAINFMRDVYKAKGFPLVLKEWTLKSK